MGVGDVVMVVSVAAVWVGWRGLAEALGFWIHFESLKESGGERFDHS